MSTASALRKGKYQEQRGSYLSGFEHYLCWVIEESQRSLGQSMGAHKNSRELHVSFPRVGHLFGAEALKVNEYKIYKSLYKCEIPTIAAESTMTIRINEGKEKLKNSDIQIKALPKRTESGTIGLPELEAIIDIFLKLNQMNL